ncbi:hypothetical protein [Paraburkholderia sp. EG304]|uniref:hypothetical protein n=1 Tax=Paraburkholderia sp. EG304 TaxID=3237015 RepID=UPI0039797992
MKVLRQFLTPAFEGEPDDAALARMGYSRPFRYLPDGRVAALMEINTWQWALVMGIHPYGHMDAFYFHSLEAARTAIDAWDGTGEPQGWFRHPQSGRRRPDGDASREYVQP